MMVIYIEGLGISFFLLIDVSMLALYFQFC